MEFKRFYQGDETVTVNFGVQPMETLVAAIKEAKEILEAKGLDPGTGQPKQETHAPEGPKQNNFGVEEINGRRIRTLPAPLPSTRARVGKQREAFPEPDWDFRRED